MKKAIRVFYTKWWFWLIIIIVLIIMVLSIKLKINDSYKDPYSKIDLRNGSAYICELVPGYPDKKISYDPNNLCEKTVMYLNNCTIISNKSTSALDPQMYAAYDVDSYYSYKCPNNRYFSTYSHHAGMGGGDFYKIYLDK